MKQKFEKSDYVHLLQDKTVKEWLENAERGSPLVAADYLRQMGRICKDFGTTPAELSTMSEKQATDFATKLVSRYEGLNLKGSTISNYLKAVKNWLSFTSGVQIKRKIKLNMDYNKYENERVPSKEELQRIFDHADIRAKATIAMMSFSGFRDAVFGNFLGDDGLKVKDFLELKMKGNHFEFEKTPTIIRVRRSLSKMGNPYFVFLPEQGCGYVKEYLEYRLRNGEKLHEDSAVVTATKGDTKMGKHIRTPKVGALIRKALRRAGFPWRPYVFRRYFDVRLMDAEADGIILGDWRAFYMGHKGSMEATYTVNKALPADTVERMRGAYAKAAAKYLTTIGTEQKMDTRTELAIRLLGISGFRPEEIEQMRVSELSDEKVNQLARERLFGAMVNNGARQKVVPADNVRELIGQGWEYVAQLPDSTVVVKLPT